MATQVAVPHRPAVPPEVRPQKLLLGRAQQEIKSAVHRELLTRIDLEKLDFLQDPRSRQSLLAMIHQLLGEQNTPLSVVERDRLAREVLDEVFGLGPLEPLLQDPTVNDILVNTYNTVYVERGGVLERTIGGLQGQCAPDAHHRQDRLRRRTADRRIVADGRRAPGRRLARERDYSSAGRRWPAAFHPPFRQYAA